jgi:hypothetical protein
MSEPIQLVTLVISTALSGDDPKAAEDQVLALLHDALGVNLEIRPTGGKGLPFELVGVNTRTVYEEDLPRP